jgi:hypothetical protein
MTITELTHTTRDIEAARSALVTARVDADMTRLALAVDLARAETDIILSAGGEKAIGGNDAARARFLTLSLTQDAAYQATRAAWAAAARTVIELEADLETLRDHRRLVEWGMREILVDRAAGVSSGRMAELEGMLLGAIGGQS